MRKEVNSLENLSVISFMNIRKFPPLIKSFFSPKKEELYRCQYSSESEFLKGIERYITFYHEKRAHSFIHYTPKMLPRKPFIILKRNEILSNKSVRIAEHFIFLSPNFSVFVKALSDSIHADYCF